MTAATPPPRRSDAERNREKILTAARTAFAGPAAPEVSMAEVARRAGVGMATLYRNFPGRRELLEALLTEEVDAVCSAAVRDGTAPSMAFTAWLREFAAFLSSKHRFAAELLKHTDAGDPVFGGGRDRVVAAGRPLLAAAQEAGEVRGELTVEQILDLIIAVVTITGDPAYIEPILTAALDGLRPPKL